MRPTMIIGLGSSGLKIVEHVQKLVYETLRTNKLPIFSYIVLETDQSKDIEETPIGNDIKTIQLRTDSIIQAINNLNEKRVKLDWIPDGTKLNAKLSSTFTEGAGGIRQGGRLSLWSGDNFKNVYDTIRREHTHIMNPDSMNRIDSHIMERVGGDIAPEAAIYVVGTLCGGTSSGIFIDIGYMLNKALALGLGSALYGIFLLPPGGKGGFHQGYANCYGSLFELDYFRDANTVYREYWPNGIYCVGETPPYTIVYLVSQEYGRATFGEISSLDGLYKIVGMQLFSNLLGLTDERRNTLADGTERNVTFYSTFGISAITHPRYAISEYVASSLAHDLCERWLDMSKYWDSVNVSHSITEHEIKQLVNEFFDDALESAFDPLGSISTAFSLRDKIDNDAGLYLKGDLKDESQYFNLRFSSSEHPEYYFSIVRKNSKDSKEILLTAIQEKVHQELSKTQSIYYTQTFIRNLIARIDETLAQWAELGIPSDQNSWKPYVHNRVRDVLNNQNKTLMLRKETVDSRLRNLTRDLEVFNMQFVLKDIKDALNDEDKTLSSKYDKFPTQEKVQSYRTLISDTIAKLKTRMQKIKDEIADTSLPIQKIWYTDGEFNGDTDDAKNRYQSEYGSVPSFEHIQAAKENLWTTLHTFANLAKGSKEFSEFLKRDLQKPIFDKFLPSVNVLDKAADETPQNSRLIAERALCGLLRVNDKANMTSGEQGIPRFIIGGSTERIRDFVSEIEVTDFLADSAPRSIGLLDNFVIFYEEKSNIEPLNDLDNLQELADNYNHVTSSFKLGLKDWQAFRMAYSLDRRKMEAEIDKNYPEAQKLLTFMADFLVEYKKDETFEHWIAKKRPGIDFEYITDDSPPLCIIQLEKRPVCIYKIDPENEESVGGLASKQPEFKTLSNSVKAFVRQKKIEGLLTMFNEHVSKMLRERYNDDPKLVNEKAEYYFGNPQKGEEGIFNKWLSQKGVSG